MKNIMLIAVVTLTIAKANAYEWKTVTPIQIVNNTNVVLEFRTEPDNTFFTLQPGETKFAPSVATQSTYFGWGIDNTTNIPPVETQSFDDQVPHETMSATTTQIQAGITLGQVVALNKVSSNDILTVEGYAQSVNDYLNMTITRTSGVGVVRGEGDDSYLADVFCLDTGVEFGLNTGASGRCPIGETRVAMANDYEIQFSNSLYNNIDDWTAQLLLEHIEAWCTYNEGCKAAPYIGYHYSALPGNYMTGFDSVPSSSGNNHITLSIVTSNTTNWVGLSPLEVVNNTPVQLEFRTEQDNQYFVVPAGQTVYGDSSNEGSTFVGWGVDDTNHGHVILTQTFDDSKQQGTISSSTVSISGNITLGTAWALVNVGYNDKLVFTGSPIGNTMQLTATRERGVVIQRLNGYNLDPAYVFCVSTNAYFELSNDANIGRCPVGENEIIMADENDMVKIAPNYPLDAWTVADITPRIGFICDYANGCVQQWPPSINFNDKISGEDMKGFATVYYSGINLYCFW